MKVRIGTRGSALALWQADHIAARLREAHEGLETERIVFTTRGDRILDRPLAEIGGKGLFTEELETSLRGGGIDLAVHSLKDLPTAMPEGMDIGAVPVRADVRDCMVMRREVTGESRSEDAPLPVPKVIGTSSLRRMSLARQRWPEATIEPIRGNVPTRVGRLLESPPRQVDAVLLAMAGLLRLEMTDREDLAFLPLNPERWIPAVGQGALAVEIRTDDDAVRALLAALHDADTAACVAAERAFLEGVEGDCRVPVGAYATIDRQLQGDVASNNGGPPGSTRVVRMRLKAFVGHPDGRPAVVETRVGEPGVELGREVAEAVLAAGGAEILKAVRAG